MPDVYFAGHMPNETFHYTPDETPSFDYEIYDPFHDYDIECAACAGQMDEPVAITDFNATTGFDEHEHTFKLKWGCASDEPDACPESLAPMIGVFTDASGSGSGSGSGWFAPDPSDPDAEYHVKLHEGGNDFLLEGYTGEGWGNYTLKILKGFDDADEPVETWGDRADGGSAPLELHFDANAQGSIENAVHFDIPADGFHDQSYSVPLDHCHDSDQCKNCTRLFVEKYNCDGTLIDAAAQAGDSTASDCDVCADCSFVLTNADCSTNFTVPLPTDPPTVAWTEYPTSAPTEPPTDPPAVGSSAGSSAGSSSG